MEGNLAVDQQGRVYVTDTGNHRVQAFGSDGTFLLSFGEWGTGTDQFSCPAGVAISPVNGDIRILNGIGRRVKHSQQVIERTGVAIMGDFDRAPGLTGDCIRTHTISLYYRLTRPPEREAVIIPVFLDALPATLPSPVVVMVIVDVRICVHRVTEIDTMILVIHHTCRLWRIVPVRRIGRQQAMGAVSLRFYPFNSLPPVDIFKILIQEAKAVMAEFMHKSAKAIWLIIVAAIRIAAIKEAGHANLRP